MAEYLQNSPLNQQVNEIFLRNDFFPLTVVPVVDMQLVSQIQAAGLQLDFRCSPNRNPGMASVFEGLAYDDISRSQAYVGLLEGQPVLTISLCIQTGINIAYRRFWHKLETGIETCDYRAITGAELPRYVIIPGWVQRKPDFKIPETTRASLMTALIESLDLMQAKAPSGTWLEHAVRGMPFDRTRLNYYLGQSTSGTVFIPRETEPDLYDILGKPNPESQAAIRFAEAQGWPLIPGFYSYSLGPLYAFQVKD